MTQQLTAWLSIGSTYSYLTAMRIETVLKSAKIDLVVKPISIRSIMRSMENIPFPSSKKSKVDYMWRDIERQAQKYGIPIPMVPAAYPLKEFDRANLVGVIVNREGRYLEYFNTTYKYWFLEGLEAGSRANLEKTLADMGLNVSSTLRALGGAQAAYDANTQEALNFGIFGVPSFSIGAEIFWGDDRLEDAIEFLGRTGA